MNAATAAAELKQLASELREEIEALELLRSDAVAAIRATNEALSATCLELARAYLPALDEPSLMAAERRTGFRGFSRRNPIQAMAHERHRLEHAVARIEADERYQRRTWLVGPQGSITVKLQEAREMLETWERECARFEAVEGFQELVATGYDTPAYALRWWDKDYWRLWSQGDRVCEALGLADFGDDVLPAWEKARAPRQQWREEVARLEAERETVLDLVRQRDQSITRLQRLPEIYLEESWKLLADHLAQADVPLLESWRGEDRAVELLLRRLSGLGARRAYFQALKDGQLAETIQQLSERRSKLIHQATKLMRPKNAGLTVPAPEPGLRDKIAKIRARRFATARTNQKVMAFDKFEQWQVPDRPSSWWPVWVDSAPPSWTPDWREAVAEQGPAARRDDDAPAQASGATGPHLGPLGDLS